MFLLHSFLFLFSILLQIKAYVPAQPSNATSGPGIQGILPANQISILALQWLLPGSIQAGFDQENVSYQLAAANTNGLNQGALVHFAEVGNMSNQSASDFSACRLFYGFY
jgi:hypothetical protein